MIGVVHGGVNVWSTTQHLRDTLAQSDGRGWGSLSRGSGWRRRPVRHQTTQVLRDHSFHLGHDVSNVATQLRCCWWQLCAPWGVIRPQASLHEKMQCQSRPNCRSRRSKIPSALCCTSSEQCTARCPLEVRTLRELGSNTQFGSSCETCPRSKSRLRAALRRLSDSCVRGCERSAPARRPCRKCHRIHQVLTDIKMVGIGTEKVETCSATSLKRGSVALLLGRATLAQIIFTPMSTCIKFFTSCNVRSAQITRVPPLFIHPGYMHRIDFVDNCCVATVAEEGKW